MLPLAECAMQITIVDDSKGKGCEVNCGVDWSSDETVALASQQMKDRFGDGIQLKYLDLSKRVTNEHTVEVKRRVRDENLSLPILLVNDKLRISGQFDVRLLLDIVDTEREITL